MADNITNITVNLRSIDDLFEEPTADPWEPNSRYRSGIDEVWAKLRTIPIHEPVGLTINLPESAFTGDLEARIQQAIRRYWTAKIEANTDEINAINKETRRDFVLSILVVTALMAFIAILVHILGLEGALLTALVSWTGIAVWAILWGPVDNFVWGRTQYRREIRLYEKLLAADLKIGKV